MVEVFWFQKPYVLIENFELWPTEDMSFDRKLNAISRLIILLTIVGVLYTRNNMIVIVALITLGIIIFLHQHKQLKVQEGFEIKDIMPNPDYNYYNSTTKNPLSNVLLTEIQDNPDRAVAPPAFNKQTVQEINTNTQQMIQNQHLDFPDMKDKLFKDLGDSVDFNNSMIPFNSNPSTQIPNDQNAFAKFCYGDMPSCKSADPNACL